MFTSNDERLEKIAWRIVNLIAAEDLGDGEILRVCISVTAYLAAIAGAEGEIVGHKVQEAIEYHKRTLVTATMPRA